MTVPATEPNQPPTNEPAGDGNPAWNDILNVLPEELHGLIKPQLQTWDQTVQDKLQNLHQQYDPYKPLVDNHVPMDVIQQGVFLAQKLEQNPEEVVQQMIDHFGLEKFKQQQQVATVPDPEEFEDLDGINIEQLLNHPQFKPLLDKQKEFEQFLENQKATQEEQEANENLENYLKQLHDEHGEFDDLYVTSLLAVGIDGVQAVNQFKQTIHNFVQANNGQQQQVTPPPVVAGASGTTGSGVPEQPVNFGQMKNSEINDLVAEYIKNSQQSG